VCRAELHGAPLVGLPRIVACPSAQEGRGALASLGIPAEPREYLRFQQQRA
jgi:hypothetical protein